MAEVALAGGMTTTYQGNYSHIELENNPFSPVSAVITTQRLILRPITKGDTNRYVQLVADPKVMQYFLNGNTHSRDTAVERVNTLVKRWQE